MSMFVVANLGDAVLNIPASMANSSGTVLTGGFVWVNNTSGFPITLTLASALMPFVVFKDIIGNANTHPITISFSGGFDGNTTTQLVLPYQWVWLAWNGANYSIIG